MDASKQDAFGAANVKTWLLYNKKRELSVLKLSFHHPID